jgi:elongator complex protein 6
VSVDEPLISAQGTALEKEHASLALSLAHDAQLVMSLRMLDTGTAKDVSGVLRVTPGGDEGIAGTTVEDRELLYFIGGDGSVRVFERGQ